jgi:putative membrane protein
MTGSYEDQAIILADSGMLQSTAEKKHLVLTLWSGEWFENMQAEELANSASVPYRRETFVSKKIILDYDGGFSMADANSLSNNARGKSLKQLYQGIDSLKQVYDSIGRVFLADVDRSVFPTLNLSKHDSIAAVKTAMRESYNFDSIFNKLTPDAKLSATNYALNKVQSEVSDLDFKSMITTDGDKLIREHRIEMISKFTLALSCLIFFFIGAPLGAIIRKGGLGVPVIISVLVFIVYYILDNTGYRMARGGMWTIEFGKGLAPAVLIPLAAFVTYKANKDSVVFNMDMYREMFMKAFGLRVKRHISSKEVIINDPVYAEDAVKLERMSSEITAYSNEHKLVSAPNIIKVFFKYQPDHEIERINDEMEKVIEDLSNTKDKVILHELNSYPILAAKSHTRPFEHQWMNVVAGLIIPAGVFFYLRMWRFRIRLYRDLKTIQRTNSNIVERIRTINL